MKSSSCTGIYLNWRRNSKKQDDSVEDRMLCYVMLCLYTFSVVVVVFVSNWGNAQCILVRWKRGSSQRRALWSAVNEALPQSKALWSAESEAKKPWQNLKFLYLSFIFRLAYLKDSNAAAHSVDSDIFQSSDSSICALQDLTLTFIS